MAAAGGRLRREAVSGPDALTPSERRVCELRRGRPQQPRDRRRALPEPSDRGVPPARGVPQARGRLARRAGGRPGRRLTAPSRQIRSRTGACPAGDCPPGSLALCHTPSQQHHLPSRAAAHGEQLHRPGHGRGPRHRQHPRLRARQGRPARRAQRRRAQRHDRRDPRRRPRGQADDRPHPRQHHRDPPAQGRRDRRLRGDRADAAVLHPAGAPAPLLRQAPDGHLRAERDHRRRAARGQGGRLPGRRPPGLHRRGADGRRDRRRAPGAPGHRQHGRRRRRRHHRGRRHLARRHRHQPLASARPATTSTRRSSRG